MDRSIRWFAFAGAGAALVLLVLLSFQNRDLKRDLGDLRQEHRIPIVGAQLPFVSAHAIDGQSIELARTDGPPQILFYFTTECPYAIASMPYVRELANSAERLGAQFVGVSAEEDVDKLRSFVAEHQLNFPVVSMVDGRTRRLFDFRISPTVFYVGPSGQTLAQHIGQIRSNKDAIDFIAAVKPWIGNAVASKEK